MGSLLCAVLAVGWADPALWQPRPEPLTRFHMLREGLETASIEFWYKNGPVPQPVRYTARLAGPDTILVNHGTESGVVGGDPARADRPHSVLKTPEHTWAHDHDGIFVTLSETGPDAAEDVFAPRSFGASFVVSYNDIGQTLWGDPSAPPSVRRYTEARDGELYVVTAEADSATVRWWIDGERGWSPIRVSFARDGQVVREARIELQNYDGVWFPKTVEVYAGAYSAGQQPVEVLRVESAEFNRPDDAHRFTPADIGVEPGFIVEKVGAQPGEEMLVWDGSQPVPLSQFRELLLSGKVQRGPTNRAALEALPAASTASSSQPDLATQDAGPGGTGTAREAPLSVRRALSKWEQYTRDFIQAHQLDADRTRKAWLTLRDCQNIANQYVRTHKAEIESAERDVNEAEAQGPQVDPQKLAATRARVSRVMHPIDSIFEKRLKPRLHALLTRAEVAATQPRDSQPQRP